MLFQHKYHQNLHISGHLEEKVDMWILEVCFLKNVVISLQKRQYMGLMEKHQKKL